MGLRGRQGVRSNTLQWGGFTSTVGRRIGGLFVFLFSFVGCPGRVLPRRATALSPNPAIFFVPASRPRPGRENCGTRTGISNRRPTPAPPPEAVAGTNFGVVHVDRATASRWPGGTRAIFGSGRVRAQIKLNQRRPGSAAKITDFRPPGLSGLRAEDYVPAVYNSAFLVWMSPPGGPPATRRPG